MPLVAAKCTQCGGELKVDSAQEAAVCIFCKMPFVIEKAVNNYNTINDIKADVVNVYGGSAADFVIRAGKLERYNGAAVDVVIPDTVTEISGVYDGEDGDIGAFQGLENLKSIIIPNSVKKIGEGAFRYCRDLTDINIPDSVTHIGREAFDSCINLATVNIPNSVTYIGGMAFFDCKGITEATLSGDVTIGTDDSFGVFSNIPMNIKIPGGTKITFKAEYSIVIPETLESLTYEQLKVLLTGLFGQYHLKSYYSSIAAKINNVDVQKLYTERREQEERRLFEERWEERRAKRKKGCYIATAVYGSYDAPEVLILRSFRDNKLNKSFFGRAFIKIYYKLSPPVAVWMKDKTKVNNIVKKVLDLLVDTISS